MSLSDGLLLAAIEGHCVIDAAHGEANGYHQLHRQTRIVTVR